MIYRRGKELICTSVAASAAAALASSSFLLFPKAENWYNTVVVVTVANQKVENFYNNNNRNIQNFMLTVVWIPLQLVYESGVYFYHFSFKCTSLCYTKKAALK